MDTYRTRCSVPLHRGGVSRVDLLRPFGECETLNRDSELGQASSESKNGVGEVHRDGTDGSDEVDKRI